MHARFLGFRFLRAAFVVILAFFGFLIGVALWSCPVRALCSKFRWKTRSYITEDVDARFFLVFQSSIDDNLVSVSSKKLVPGFIMVRNDPSGVCCRTILDLTGACGMAADVHRSNVI